MKEEKEVKRTDAQEAELAQVANRPLAGQQSKPVDHATASHLWQAGSPAVNTNVNSEDPMGTTNILDKIDTKENVAAREKANKEAEAAAIESMNTQDEVTDCSKLDVSDPRYCQPGSARHKTFLKKNK